MAKCFAACGCDDYEGVTKADLDRFTDKIDNVLNDDKGRRLFRNFMFTSKMKDGKRTLDFYEHVEKCLNRKDGAESASYHTFLDEIDKVIDEAERIEELDFAMMERLTQVRDARDKAEIVVVLRLLKAEAAKILRREYSAFRRHFVPAK